MSSAHRLILGTAGHVDHGKTSLIRALTGVDCDTHPEEKKRGITIQLGFTHLTLPSGLELGIIDVPGHQDFVRTAISGILNFDLVLFVVSAKSGPGAQTKEHLQILNLLNIKTGVTVLTQVDLATAEEKDNAKIKIKKLLAGTFLESSPLLEVSSLTGEGIPTLVQKLDELATALPAHSTEGPFRLAIDRAFSIPGQGAVVTGTVTRGETKSGNELLLQPTQQKVRIRGLHRFGKAVDSIQAGDRAALNLTGPKLSDLIVGREISSVRISESKMFDAKIKWLDRAANKTWIQATLIAGMQSREVRLHLLGEDFAQVHLPAKSKALLLERGDSFLLLPHAKSERVLGSGKILDPTPLHHRRKTPKLLANLRLSEVAWSDYQQTKLKPAPSQSGKSTPAPAASAVSFAGSPHLEFFLKEIKKTGLQAPVTADLMLAGKTLGLDEKKSTAVLKALTESKAVILAEGHYLDAAIVERARILLVQAIQKKPQGLTVAEFRDLLGANRKLCLILFSIFDREGITRREGDFRVLTQRGKEIVP